MSWLKSVNDKLFMALTSKGRPQHKCDCEENPSWNDGWTPTGSPKYNSIIRAENTDGIVDGSSDDDFREMYVPELSSEGMGTFDTIKMTYASDNNTLPKTFYIRSICIKLKGGSGCYVPTIANTYGGEYTDASKSTLTGNLAGYVDGLFAQGTSGFGMWHSVDHGAEYYIVLGEPIRYADVESVKWKYFLNDADGVAEMQFNDNYRLFETGEVAVHNDQLWEALGKINDADDEPGRSIHWKWVCECADIVFPTPPPTPTPTPTPSPEPTPTPSPEPTPTPTPECICADVEDWFPAIKYEMGSMVSYEYRIWIAHDTQGTQHEKELADGEFTIADVPGKSNHWQLVCECLDTPTPTPFVCCKDHLHTYLVGPDGEAIVDGANQITVGKQLYKGTLCVDSGSGDFTDGLIESCGVYLPDGKPIGTIIFNGGVNTDPSLYLSIEDSTHAVSLGYSELDEKCFYGKVKYGRCDLTEAGK